MGNFSNLEYPQHFLFSFSFKSQYRVYRLQAFGMIRARWYDAFGRRFRARIHVSTKVRSNILVKTIVETAVSTPFLLAGEGLIALS